MVDPAVQSTSGLDISTKLAFDRTLVAYERTMPVLCHIEIV